MTAAPILGVRTATAATAGAVKQAESDVTVYPDQTVDGRKGVPITGRQIRAGGTFGMTPGQEAYGKGTGDSAVAYRQDLTTRVAQGFELTQRLNEQQQLVRQFRIGATGPARAKLAAVARDMGMSEGVVQGIGGGDPAAAQAFTKFAAQSALEQLRQSIGANRMLQAEVTAFQKANPNIATDPQAFDKVEAFQRHLYERDYNQQQQLDQWERSGKDPAQFPAAFDRFRHPQAQPPGRAASGTRQPAPGGMRQIGTYRGRPMYQDAQGRRFAG